MADKTPVTTRDPRTDPKQGDVLGKGKRQRTVLGTGDWRGPWVIFQTRTCKRKGLIQQVRKEWWDKWVVGAEVIHAAE
jgi:hypothetical protein